MDTIVTDDVVFIDYKNCPFRHTIGTQHAASIAVAINSASVTTALPFEYILTKISDLS
jgi:hypothetical protein